jgi:hypothetical protein
MIKKTLMVLSAIAALVVSAAIPRSEWHAKIGECALDPVVLKATVAQLSSADKTAFLAEINEAISKMPGSAEVKAAQFLAANRAAVAGAGSADRAAVLAEVFATVPPESLTVIIEEFSKSEFSRPATMDDSQYTNIVASAISKIVQRCSSSELGNVRSAMAGLMFVKSAGTAAEQTQNIVIDALPQDSRSEASNSWYPAALGKDQAQSYDPILAAAQADEEPDHTAVIAITSAQVTESMLADLQAGGLPATQAAGNRLGGIPADYPNFDVDAMNVTIPMPSRGRVLGPAISQSFLTGDPADKHIPVENPWYSDGRKDGDKEPGPYWLQKL